MKQLQVSNELANLHKDNLARGQRGARRGRETAVAKKTGKWPTTIIPSVITAEETAKSCNFSFSRTESVIIGKNLSKCLRPFPPPTDLLTSQRPKNGNPALITGQWNRPVGISIILRRS